MYAAKIELGWINKCFEGESPTEIISKLEEYQDFGCLLNMGRAQEGKKGQKKLDKLEVFLNKYYDGTLSKLQKSSFRAKFHLAEKDKQYIKEKRIDTIREHAADFVRQRLAPADIPNDGKQTPMRGHPVFVAQHACVCCCRGCLK